MDVSGFKSDSWYEAWEFGIGITNFQELKLVPIGEWILAKKDAIGAFAHWRFLARDMFFARFPESSESMKNYLQNVSIKRQDVLLFVIANTQQDAFGHIGLTSINDRSAEIDSVMRSSDCDLRGLMSASLESLAIWSHEVLGLQELTLKVISYNDAALKLYERNGFVVTNSIPLKKHVEGEFVSHEEVHPSLSNVDYECLVMSMPLSIEA